MRAKIVLALAALLFAWNIWGYDLWAPDEPYFGEGAREMVVDGQWAVPHVNGVVTTDKPPLFFWLIALASLPFGHVFSVTARLPSAFAMIVAAALTMRLARRLSGRGSGALAGLVFVTTYLVWDKGRTAQIDALLCLLILVGLSAFEAFRSGQARGRAAGLLFWTAAAFATLAKGPVGFLLPLGIALVVLATDRDLRAWRRFAPWSGPLVFLAIVAAWMLLATLGGHGEYSVWEAFRRHVLDRAVYGMHHKQPFWYYATVLPVQLLPWTALAPAAVVLALRRRDAGDRFLLSWAGFVVLFFSIPVEKRDLYVLPAYPAFAILTARLVAEIESGAARVSRRLATIPHTVLAGILVLVGFALPTIAARSGALPPRATFLTAAALVATGLAIVVLAARRGLRSAVAATAVGTMVAYLATATFIFPALDPVKSARAFSGVLAALARTSGGETPDVAAFDVGNLPEAFAFYTNGLYTKVLPSEAALASHLERPDRVLAVVDARDLTRLPEPLRDRVVVLHRAELAGKPVVVVANR